MKKHVRFASLVLALLFVICLIPAGAFAGWDDDEDDVDYGSCGDGVYWSMEDGVLTISGEGAMDDYRFPSNDSWSHLAPWLKYYRGVPFEFDGEEFIDYYCDVINKVVVEEGVTHIGEFAFARMLTLEDVELPSTLTSIGRGAFREDESLQSIDLPDGLTSIGDYMFMFCTALEEIRIPDGVRTVWSGLCYGCTSLKTAYMPAADWICGYVFDNCSALKDVYYPGSRESWNAAANNKELLPEGAELHTYYRYNELSNCNVSIKYSTYAYTENDITPHVTVKTAAGTTLKEGKNYTVEYSSNRNCGTATVTVTAIGKYKGTKALTFSIRPAMVKNVRTGYVSVHEATIRWDSHPTAEKFYIYIGNTLKGETTDTTFTLTRLKGGRTRKVYVRAVITLPDENGVTHEYLSLAKALSVTTHTYVEGDG